MRAKRLYFLKDVIERLFATDKQNPETQKPRRPFVDSARSCRN